MVVGLTQSSTGFEAATDRPASLDGYNQDLINGVVANYCDPAPYRCVDFVAAPGGAVRPVAPDAPDAVTLDYTNKFVPVEAVTGTIRGY